MALPFRQLSDFQYNLPPGLIAQEPAPVRDEARLLVLRRSDGSIEHRRFRELGEYLPSSSVLALNDTKVIPGKLYGRKPTGGRLDFLLLRPLEGHLWEAMVSGKAKAGTQFGIGEYIQGRLLERSRNGFWRVYLEYEGNIMELLSSVGHTPLPPYIKRKPGQENGPDRERYQTVYARKEGAVAAPTAGLHFTPGFLSTLEENGLQIVTLTLHIGPGTFLPVKTRNIHEHHLCAERYHIPEETAVAVETAWKENRPVVAVGTSTLRTLESAAYAPQRLRSGTAQTELYIYPGYQFKNPCFLLTNFHLPCSTNLMLVAALAGYELTMEAYRVAVEERYRFYSYGDAMLIL